MALRFNSITVQRVTKTIFVQKYKRAPIHTHTHTKCSLYVPMLWQNNIIISCPHREMCGFREALFGCIQCDQLNYDPSCVCDQHGNWLYLQKVRSKLRVRVERWYLRGCVRRCAWMLIELAALTLQSPHAAYQTGSRTKMTHPQICTLWHLREEKKRKG